jgi:hypothetical protein
MSRRVHVLKSSDLATWTRLPLPFVPKAYHAPSALCTKLGSGKSALIAIHGPLARFSTGEAKTAVIRPMAQNVNRVTHMFAEWMDKIEEEIVEVNCCISEPQAHSMTISWDQRRKEFCITSVEPGMRHCFILKCCLCCREKQNWHSLD